MRRFLPFGFISLLSLATGPLGAQAPTSAFQNLAGVSLHYLDFGGEGLPIVFIHAADRGAETWIDFAPQFTDHHRVLAITARGVGESTGEPSPTDVRAADLVGLLDALGLARAVFIGNSSPAADMTYLAEHYPDRVAGLVYLANAPPVAGLNESDPTGAFAYALRATNPPNPFPYRPEYLDEPTARIDLPALTFVGESGTRGMERQVLPLMVARMVASRGSDWIEDAEARSFLQRLAEDEKLQAEVASAWAESVAPAIVNNERTFQNAFGENLRVVQLPVPLVNGYEYRDRPDLITPHIRSFLEGLVR